MTYVFIVRQTIWYVLTHRESFENKQQNELFMSYIIFKLNMDWAFTRYIVPHHFSHNWQISVSSINSPLDKNLLNRLEMPHIKKINISWRYLFPHFCQFESIQNSNPHDWIRYRTLYRTMNCLWNTDIYLQIFMWQNVLTHFMNNGFLGCFFFLVFVCQNLLLWFSLGFSRPPSWIIIQHPLFSSANDSLN